MSKGLWCLLLGGSWLLAGAILGFAVALAWASLDPAPNDGTFAMWQMLVCLPLGALTGLVAGVAWAVR